MRRGSTLLLVAFTIMAFIGGCGGGTKNGLRVTNGTPTSLRVSIDGESYSERLEPGEANEILPGDVKHARGMCMRGAVRIRRSSDGAQVAQMGPGVCLDVRFDWRIT